MVVESLANNSLQAASWLDHWLLTVSEMFDEGEVSQQVQDMLCSGGKAVRYIASQSASLWASSILMRRDAVLSGNRTLPQDQRLKLRNAPLLSFASLFPGTVVQELSEERQAKRESSLFSNVARLADSAQKAAQKQSASSAGPSTSSSSSKKGNKKKSAPPQAKGQRDAAQSTSSSDGNSFQGRKGKRAHPGQNFRGGKGKGKGRGRGGH